MSHVARWARMGRYPRVTLISLLLMARWAVCSGTVRAFASGTLHAPVRAFGCRPVSPITNPVGPVGPYVTRGPVGSYGMLSPCNSISYPDQPVADGPVGLYVARGPVGSYGMLSLCDSDQLIADGPVGPYVPEPLEPSVLGLSMHG